MQKILTSRALDLAQAQDNAVLTSDGESTRTHREKHRPTPLSIQEEASHNEERESSVNINRSALRSATAASQPSPQDDTDSDAPLTKRRRWRKKEEEVDASRQPVSAPKVSIKAKKAPRATNSQPAPQTQTIKQNMPSWQTHGLPALNVSNHPARAHTSINANIPLALMSGFAKTQQTSETPDSPVSNASKGRSIRRNEPFRISTALPENDPPLGPHCHCRAASDDITLLPCADCGNKYHPRCIGKGRFAKGTYGGKGYSHMLKDLELFEDRPFKCGDCEEAFFGGR